MRAAELPLSAGLSVAGAPPARRLVEMLHLAEDAGEPREALRKLGLECEGDLRELFAQAIRALDEGAPLSRAIRPLLEEDLARWGALLSWDQVADLPEAAVVDALHQWIERIQAREAALRSARVTLILPALSAWATAVLPWLVGLQVGLFAPAQMSVARGAVLAGFVAMGLLPLVASVARTMRWLRRANACEGPLLPLLTVVCARVRGGEPAASAVGRAVPQIAELSAAEQMAWLVECVGGGFNGTALAPLGAALALVPGAAPPALVRALRDQLKDEEAAHVARWGAEANTWALLVVASAAVSMACFVAALFVVSFVR